jgi:acetyl-CoA C-acetyltransferase
VTTLASAGEHALVYGYLRLLAQQGRRLLVLAWSKESESVDPRHAGRVAAEPFLLRPLGVDATVAAGLQAGAYSARYGLDAEAVTAVRAQRQQAAARAHGDTPSSSADGQERYVAWPLTAADLPKSADVACAAVLAAGDAVTSAQDPAWITGVGWSTDRYDLGERDLSRFEALETAARQAFGDGPDLDGTVFEVQEISTVGGFAAYEALGLCPAGRGSEVAAGSGPAVNPSGGNLPVNPGNAAGFLRMLSAAQQVRGRAGTGQLDPSPRRGVGAALHGFAGQGAAVMVFASENDNEKVS